MVYLIKEGEQFMYLNQNLTLTQRLPKVIKALDENGKIIKIKKESAPHLWQTLLVEAF